MKQNGIAISILVIFMLFVIVTASGDFWPDQKPENNNPGSYLDIEEPQKPDTGLTQYALELERPLGAEEQAELGFLAELAGTLDSGTVLVRAKENKEEELKALSFVKDAWEYQPALKLSSDLDEQSTTGEKVQVTVTLFSAADKNIVQGLVNNLGGTVVDGMDGQGPYLRIEINHGALEELASSPRVIYIEKSLLPELLNDRIRDITGTRPLSVPGFINSSGLTGQGQTIGLADSGLDAGSMGNLHPDLQSEPGKKPRVIMLKSWAGVETPADNVGHGTHMAATMVGSGAASNGLHAGIAPDASIYFQGVVDKNDKPSPPLDLKDLFYPAYDADVRVHVNGWGRKQNSYSSTPAQIDDFVLKYSDFLPIFGAGNSGPRVGSLTSEANSKNALTVGASMSTRPAFDDRAGDTGTVADFSSRGPAGDGRIKPELLAPGTSIISAASRLVQGNLPGRPQYTIMQGTSMASAVTGGAATLLRQYFQEQKSMDSPSAALLKATLINGARVPEGGPGETGMGFGILDLASTVLALENSLFKAEDNQQGITTGETITYEIKITHSDAPFKATLAWTDPPAVPGATTTLVNNLDLEVIAPNGDTYYGNDFENRGVRDDRNNVEQVYIPEPEPGLYKVNIKGNSVIKNASFSGTTAQDFSVVYGQLPVKEIINENSEDIPKDALVTVNDKILPGAALPPAGADLYLIGSRENPSRAYAVGKTWEASGVRMLTSGDTGMFVRMNREHREGGYIIDGTAQNAVYLNGHLLDLDQKIPPGAGVKAYINPTLQTAWKAEFATREVSGVLTGIELDKKQVRLLDRDKAYTLAEDVSLSFSDIIVDGSIEDLPYGASDAADLEMFLPGMYINLGLGDDDKIYHMAVRRNIAPGRVEEVNINNGTITLTSGRSYHLMPGINVFRDGMPVQVKDIKQGDLAILNLLPGSNEILGITAYSRAIYGRLIYAEDSSIYIMDNTGGFRTLRPGTDMQVFRWGLSTSASVLSPGQWVRLMIEPRYGDVSRVDIAEVAVQAVETFEGYVQAGRKIQTKSGETYLLSNISTLAKNDYPVRPEDLVPGETLNITALSGPSGEKIIASLEARTMEGVEPPVLEVKSTIPMQQLSLVTGQTSASMLYARYPDGSLQQVELTTNGEFYHPVSVSEVDNIRLVAVDRETGGVSGVQLNFVRRDRVFEDINNHWAEVDIRYLVSRGMLAGYSDGTFKPDNAVTRVEFAAMLTRLMGAEAGSTAAELPYKDAGDIPRWARQAVALAHSRGLATGYDDNTFRPHAPITREEAAVLLVRAKDILAELPEEQAKQPPYSDWDNVAEWAMGEVSTAYQLGLLTGRENNRFAPKSNITRAETAAILNRLLHSITK